MKLVSKICLNRQMCVNLAAIFYKSLCKNRIRCEYTGKNINTKYLQVSVLVAITTWSNNYNHDQENKCISLNSTILLVIIILHTCY